jgi:O-antigen/teichoic acid export membrane protein
MTVTLTIVPLGIKHLGENEYGRWVGLNSMSGWAALTDLGVAGMLVFHLSKCIEQKNLSQAALMLWHGLILSAGTAILGAVVLSVTTSAAIWTNPNSFKLAQLPFLSMACLTTAVALSQLGNALSALQQATLMPMANAFVSIIASIGSLLTCVALLPTLGAAAFAVGQLVRSLLQVVPLAFWNIRFLISNLPSVSLDRKTFIPFFAAGILGMANRWLQGILVNYDAFSISIIEGPAQATHYVNTSRPASMATGLSSSLGTALMPLFSRHYATNSPCNSHRVYLACVRMELAVCSALAIAFVCAYRPLIARWIGPEFVLPPVLVAAISLAAVAQAWLGFASYLFGGSGHFVLANKLLLVEGLIRGASMTLAALVFGILGLTLAAAVTQLVAVMCHVYAMSRFSSTPVHWGSLASLSFDITVVACFLLIAAFVDYGSESLTFSILLGGSAGLILLLFIICRDRELREALLRAVIAVLPAPRPSA